MSARELDINGTSTEVSCLSLSPSLSLFLFVFCFLFLFSHIIIIIVMQAKLTVLVMACTQGYRDIADLFLRHPKIAVNQQIAVKNHLSHYFSRFITDFPCSCSVSLFRFLYLEWEHRTPWSVYLRF
jgi:hypothetical protein